MAAIGTVEVPMSKAVQRITVSVRVTGVLVARFRLWLGILLLRLGSFIAGCGIEIDVPGDALDMREPRYRSWQMIAGKEVPRQLSLREGSALWLPNWWDLIQGVDIYLDGVKQDEVISYDCDAGFVRVNSLVNGSAVLDATGEEVATVLVHGKVELRPA